MLSSVCSLPASEITFLTLFPAGFFSFLTGNLLLVLGILFHSSAKTDREHELWGRVQGLENKVQTRECWILLSCISLLDLESFAFFTCPAIVSWHFLEAGQWRGNQKNKIRRLPLISFAFTFIWDFLESKVGISFGFIIWLYLLKINIIPVTSGFYSLWNLWDRMLLIISG